MFVIYLALRSAIELIELAIFLATVLSFSRLSSSISLALFLYPYPGNLSFLSLLPSPLCQYFSPANASDA